MPITGTAVEPPFIGENRHGLVDGLIALFDKVNISGKPRWVSFEAPSGWGKTRVAQEFYARLARDRQPDPGYWPSRILQNQANTEDAGARRKKVFPNVDHTPRSLPAFFWWGIACSVRNGIPSVALAEDLGQFNAHAPYLDDAWLKIATMRERNRGWARETGRAVVDEGFMEGVGKIVEEVTNQVIPGLGLAKWVGGHAWTGILSTQQRNERFGGTELIESNPVDIVDSSIGMLTRLARPGLPIVLFIEDAHDADAVLVELLTRLINSGAAVLIITTAWPGHTGNNIALREAMKIHAADLTRISHTDEILPQPFPPGSSMHPLNEDQLAELVNFYYPKVHPTTRNLLTSRYPNPLALELVCQKPIYRNKFQDGALRLSIDEVNKLPATVHDLYRDLWNTLPENVRCTLNLAALCIPQTISEHFGRTAEWHQPMLLDVIGALAKTDTRHVSAYSLDSPATYAWARIVSDALYRFHEPDQMAIAIEEDGFFNSEEILDILVVVLSKKFSNEEFLTADEVNHAATLVLALHHRGFLVSADILVNASETVLKRLSLFPRELPRRIRIARYTLQHVDPQSVSGINLRGSLGNILFEAGQIKDSINILESLLMDLDRLSGPEHLATLTTRNNLAASYGKAGHLAKAITEFQKLLAISCRIKGNEHPETLATRNNLASFYADAGRTAEAITEFRRLLIDLYRVRGPEHPNTLATRNNLASCYADARRTPEAITEFQTLLIDRERILGPEHPETLSTRSFLASCYGDAGHIAEAITGFQTLLIDQERILGPEHPRTLATRGRLADSYWLAGRIGEAITELEALLIRQYNVLGTEHLDTYITRSNLASYYGKDGRTADAISQFQTVLMDLERVLGPEHPHTLRTRSNFAGCYAEARRIAEAITELQALLVVQERVLGPEHPDIFTTRANLATCYVIAGRIAEAVTELQALLVVQERVLGPEHPDTLEIRRKLEIVLKKNP